MASTTTQPQPVDPATNPYLSGRFAPVHDEIDTTDLRVAGKMAMRTSVIRHPEEPSGGEDVFFHPLAFPLLAGPGALAVVLGLSNRHDSWLDFPGFFIGIAAICLVAFAAMALAVPITRRLGPKGLEMLTRVMGLIVLAVAAELVFHGIADHFALEVSD